MIRDAQDHLEEAAAAFRKMKNKTKAQPEVVEACFHVVSALKIIRSCQQL